MPGGSGWCYPNWLSFLPEKQYVVSFYRSPLALMPPGFPIPDPGGGWGPHWERLPIPEGSRTQGAFSAPASAAFAAVLTASPCPPEGTVLEGEALQGRLRHQAPWHTQGREFAVVSGGWELFPGHVKGWEGERAGKTPAHLSPWCPGPPRAVLQGYMSCRHLEISGSACSLHPWEFAPTLPHCKEDVGPVCRLSVAREQAVLAEQGRVCGNGGRWGGPWPP